KTCTDTKEEITVEVAANEGEAKFKCDGAVTALYPADCNGDDCPNTELARSGDQKVQRICEDAECQKIKVLNDVFPGATRDDSTDEHVHVLKFPKEDRPQKDVWYQCRSPQRTNPCKVKISVAAALKDPPADQICSQDNSRVIIEVGEDTTEARFKCSDALTTLDPHDCSGDSCQEEVAHDHDEPVSMIYEDEDCSTAKHLDQVFPGATRHDDATNHVYKLTIPKEGRTTKAAWYQCKGSERNSNTLCKVKINVTAARPTPPTPEAKNKCTAGGEELNLSASPQSPLTFVCPNDLPLKPSETRVYDNSDSQCTNEVNLSSLVDATLSSTTQVDTLAPGDTTYTLTVRKLPPERALLCYRCAGRSAFSDSFRKSRNPDDEADCLVKVTIEADPTSTSPPTTPTETPSTPTTSSAIAQGGSPAPPLILLVVTSLVAAIGRL
ncbi:SAG-related sequence protein SRS26A, partial [Toxoplasma gondii GT1]